MWVVRWRGSQVHLQMICGLFFWGGGMITSGIRRGICGRLSEGVSDPVISLFFHPNTKVDKTTDRVWNCSEENVGEGWR